MRKLGFVACLSLTAAAAPSAPDTEFAWDCKFSQRQVCSPKGCVSNQTKTWVYLNPSQNAYWRCEGKYFENCDRYQALVSESGAYRNFELPGRATFAKVGPNLSVTEVVTLMDTVYVNRGKCIVVPPPLVRLR